LSVRAARARGFPQPGGCRAFPQLLEAERGHRPGAFDVRADSGVREAPSSIIGMNATRASSDDRLRFCWT
jgi:hypothetical protein